MKKACFLFSILLVVGLSLFVSAELTASISNPRMVLYGNITGEELVLENSVIVNNNNDYPVQITINPKDVWEGKVVLAESNFSLSAGERKEVAYTVRLKDPGYYDGDIIVQFNEPNAKTDLAIAQNLVVIAGDKNGNVPKSGEWDSKKFILLILGIVVLVILLAILLSIKKRKKSK